MENGDPSKTGYDHEANNILTKALEAWAAKHHGAKPDFSSQEEFQKFVGTLSKKDFNHILNDRVPNLVYKGDVVTLDSNGNYEINAPSKVGVAELGETRAGHIETEELTHRLGKVADHVEHTTGLAKNPLEDLKWETEVLGVGEGKFEAVQALKLDSLFGTYSKINGQSVFERAVGYDYDFDGEIDSIWFYKDGGRQQVSFFSEVGESKIAFFRRVELLAKKGKLFQFNPGFFFV